MLSNDTIIDLLRSRTIYEREIMRIEELIHHEIWIGCNITIYDIIMTITDDDMLRILKSNLCIHKCNLEYIDEILYVKNGRSVGKMRKRILKLAKALKFRYDYIKDICNNTTSEEIIKIRKIIEEDKYLRYSHDHSYDSIFHDNHLLAYQKYRRKYKWNYDVLAGLNYFIAAPIKKAYLLMEIEYLESIDFSIVGIQNWLEAKND